MNHNALPQRDREFPTNETYAFLVILKYESKASRINLFRVRNTHLSNWNHTKVDLCVFFVIFFGSNFNHVNLNYRLELKVAEI